MIKEKRWGNENGGGCVGGRGNINCSGGGDGDGGKRKI